MFMLRVISHTWIITVGHQPNSEPNLPRAENFSKRADTVAGLLASAIKGVVKSVADKKRWQAPVATFKQWQTEYEKEYQSLLWLCCTMDGARAIVRRHFDVCCLYQY